VPFPYNIIVGRETALPCPLYHSDADGRKKIQPAQAGFVCVDAVLTAGFIQLRNFREYFQNRQNLYFLQFERANLAIFVFCAS
jgi:hypothetical protein